MTVGELVDWLQRQPQDATVVVQDADTGWFLRVKIGPSTDTYNKLRPVPDGYVVVSGDYGDEIIG